MAYKRWAQVIALGATCLVSACVVLPIKDDYLSVVVPNADYYSTRCPGWLAPPQIAYFKAGDIFLGLKAMDVSLYIPEGHFARLVDRKLTIEGELLNGDSFTRTYPLIVRAYLNDAGPREIVAKPDWVPATDDLGPFPGGTVEGRHFRYQFSMDFDAIGRREDYAIIRDQFAKGTLSVPAIEVDGIVQIPAKQWPVVREESVAFINIFCVEGSKVSPPKAVKELRKKDM